jgi:hypothetical protein
MKLRALYVTMLGLTLTIRCAVSAEHCEEHKLTISEKLDGPAVKRSFCSKDSVEIQNTINNGARVDIQAGAGGVVFDHDINGNGTNVSIETDGPVIVLGTVDNPTSRFDVRRAQTITVKRMDGGGDHFMWSEGTKLITDGIGNADTKITFCGPPPTTTTGHSIEKQQLVPKNPCPTITTTHDPIGTWAPGDIH